MTSLLKLGFQLALLLLVSACNDSNDSLSGSITEVPALQDITNKQILQINRSLNLAISFGNTGGNPTSCSLAAGQTIPKGLTVGVSADKSSCAITGMPTMLAGEETYSVVAENADGSSMATVSITVQEEAPVSSASCDPSLPESMQTGANYQVTVNTVWNQANNGVALPRGAHFTTFIGATHNADYQIWGAGVMATAGVEDTAETGNVGTMRGEIVAQRTSGDVGEILSFGAPPTTGSSSENFMITCAYPLVSLLSMVAPSPDWFIGVHDVDLLDDNDNWRASMRIKLYPYDAGTEDTPRSGTPFSLNGTDSTPHTPIVRLAGSSTIGFVPPNDLIGTIVFLRMDGQ